MHEIQALSKDLYGNILITAPNGEALCRCNQDKAEWYLSRDLAEIASSEPCIIRLKFEPKGRGHAGDAFYLSAKPNHCVVCSQTNDLTKHHIVPYCFRKHFPERLKRHNSHDICLLCLSCHYRYEKHADCLKRDLAKQYGVTLTSSVMMQDRQAFQIKRYAAAIRNYRDRIPSARLQVMEQAVCAYLRVEQLTEQVLDQFFVDFSKRARTDLSYGETIMRQILNLTDFVILWRKHFVEIMQPRHMPEHWNVYKTLS